MPIKTKHSKEFVKDRLLTKLDEVIDNEMASTRDVLKAIELYGKEFGLFVEQRNIKIDVNTVVRQLSDKHLKALVGEVDSDRDVIDVQPWIDVGEGSGDASAGGRLDGSTDKDTVGVDQGESGTDREET